jgi:hypothetical protein
VDDREVVTLDLEGPLGCSEDLDLAGRVGLDPDACVTRSDVT